MADIPLVDGGDDSAWPDVLIARCNEPSTSEQVQDATDIDVGANAKRLDVQAPTWQGGQNVVDPLRQACVEYRLPVPQDVAGSLVRVVTSDLALGEHEEAGALRAQCAGGLVEQRRVLIHLGQGLHFHKAG